MWETAAAILVSLGGGGAIVAGLSNWLGRVWAQRLMQEDRARHNQELANLRASLEASNQARLAEIQRDVAIYQEKHLGAHRDKIDAYRKVVDVVAPLLAAFDRFALGLCTLQELRSAIGRFDEDRIRLYGYLALVAPQSVMDSQDALMDYLLGVFDGSQPGEWKKIRTLTLNLINEARKDVGIDSSPIEYRGPR